jgi:Protein of unknown function (DUF669)
MGNVNWSDLQRAAGDAGFDPLPPSTYDVIVDEASATQSSNGKDMIKATFKVEGGPHDTRKIFNQFVISPDSPNGLAFFFRHMAVLGLKEDFFANNPTTEMVAGALVGRRCRVKVSIRQWNEQDRNQVDAVLPAAAGVGLSVAPTVTAPTPGLPSTSSSGPTLPSVTPAPAPTVTPVAPVPGQPNYLTQSTVSAPPQGTITTAASVAATPVSSLPPAPVLDELPF